jgi:aminoglycoside phosphotransferase family enzyme
MKKPVRHAFLDFSTVQAREHDAREELRLNRRLAPQVYLGVLALRRHEGEFALVPADTPAPGEAVDWLVLMQRLPAEHMLDHLIAHRMLVAPQIDVLADVLARFYRDAPATAVWEPEYLRRLQQEQRDNRAVLLDARFAVPQALAVADRYDDALAAHAELVGQRAREGRLVEGHGDLRPEHVAMLDPPVVIDCLEFNATLRQIDPFDEIAYLGMECEAMGCAWVGPRLWERLAQRLADSPPPALRHLYAARRAMMRARLALAHLLDAHPATPERWVPRTSMYLAQAEAALQRLQEA